MLMWACMTVLWTLVTSTTPPSPGIAQAPTVGHCSGSEALPSLLQATGTALKCIAEAINMNNGSDLNIIQEIRDTMSAVREGVDTLKKAQNLPTNCRDLQVNGDNESGIRLIYPYLDTPNRRAVVFCDQETDGGGWTVFQRRQNLPQREDFSRSWVEYQLGFGDMEGEFWLGLELIRQLTSGSLQQMWVDLEDYDGEKKWAKYGFFNIGASSENYRINVGRYNGTAGDGFGSGRHNGYAFTTYDQDHDTYKDNCASLYKGGWWYDSCHISNLNGYQHVGTHESYADGIGWFPWKGYHYSLKYTSMMVRPAF